MNYLGIDFKWELNLKEKEFIKYLVEHDYKIKEAKEFPTKIKLKIEKDGVVINYEIPYCVSNMNKFIKNFEHSFELSKKVYEMGQRL